MRWAGWIEGKEDGEPPGKGWEEESKGRTSWHQRTT